MAVSRKLQDQLFGLTTPTQDELEARASEEQDLIDAEMLRVEMAAAGDPDARAEIRESMDNEEFNNAISAAISKAELYLDSELSGPREEASRYYRGDKFGDEDPDASGVVMTEVRDTVLALLPQLIKIFCGTTNPVEFVNNMATPKEQAEYQTEYVKQVLMKDNEGFMLFLSAFKDALIRKTGVFTWWFEEREMVIRDTYTGLDEDAFALLQMDEKESQSGDLILSRDIEILDEQVDTMAPGEEPDLTGAEAEAQQAAFDLGIDGDVVKPPENFIRDVQVIQRVIRRRLRVAAVPPEEYILVPITSSDIDEFPLVGRRQMKTIGELVALGHDEEVIRKAIGSRPGGRGNNSSNLEMNTERQDRLNGNADRIFNPDFDKTDPSSEEIKYCEVYVLIDYDGDGIPERRFICTVGDDNRVVSNEIMDGDMVPFSTICPDPEPHSPFGYSLADQTMDLQEVKSEVVRGILDSLAESIFGRTEIVDGKVNIDDALSRARHQLVRVKEAGSINTIAKTFIGGQAMPLAAYIDEIKARRTGITLAPAGLDAQALQSTDKKVAETVVDSSQDRAVMIARIFAETGIKRLMRGILKLGVKHQDKPREIRIKGAPIVVDPRTFATDLDMEVNVGLGSGNSAKRMMALQMILAQQKEITETYGLNNPFVTPDKISNAAEDFIREAGFNDVSRYMNIITPEKAKQLMDAEAAKPPQPSPEELLAQANREKVQADLQKATQTNQTKMATKEIDDRFRRDKLAVDQNIKAGETMAKYGLELEKMDVQREQHDETQADGIVADANAYANPQTQSGNEGR